MKVVIGSPRQRSLSHRQTKGIQTSKTAGLHAPVEEALQLQKPAAEDLLESVPEEKKAA